MNNAKHPTPRAPDAKGRCVASRWRRRDGVLLGTALFILACGGRVEESPTESTGAPDASGVGGAGQTDAAEVEASAGQAMDGQDGSAGVGEIDDSTGVGGAGVAGSEPGDAGVAGSSGTAGSGGSTPLACDYLAKDYLTCRECVREHCWDPCAFCEADPTCIVYLVCILHCSAEDPSCLASCAESTPESAAAGAAFMSCMKAECHGPCHSAWGY